MEVWSFGWHRPRDARDKGISERIFEQYSGELYGLLCSLTGGEAKNVIKGMGETGVSEGFKAMALLSKRFDSRTSASLLQAYLEVVAPTGLKGNDIIPGINRWETRVQLLRGRHDEDRK